MGRAKVGYCTSLCGMVGAYSPLTNLPRQVEYFLAQAYFYFTLLSVKMTLIQTLPLEILDTIRRALAEDIGPGDVTTDSIVPAGALMHGHIIAKQTGVVAGLDVAAAVYQTLDPQVDFVLQVDEGSRVADRQVLALVAGPARSLLTAERTALNFLGRMSGIATLTRQFVDAVAGTQAVILDTRKTAPGLRAVDKLAVARGGGKNHRIGLYDMILIKDNHIDFAGSLAEAVKRARLASSGLEVEVEARTLEDVPRRWRSGRRAHPAGQHDRGDDDGGRPHDRRARQTGGLRQRHAGDGPPDRRDRRGLHLRRRADPFGASASMSVIRLSEIMISQENP